MLTRHFIERVINNYTFASLSDNFYDFSSPYKFITDIDFPLLEPYYSTGIINIVRWENSDTYWIIAMEAILRRIRGEIIQIIDMQKEESKVIKEITTTLPCILDLIIEKYTVSGLEININRIKPSTKLIDAKNMPDFNITAGYKYMPFSPALEDTRVFAGTVIGSDIVSLCSMELPTYNTCVTIGISTEEEHRCHGYAVSNVAALSRYIIQRGGTVCYSCRSTNSASQRTALAAGLKKAAHVYCLKVRQDVHNQRI